MRHNEELTGGLGKKTLTRTGGKQRKRKIQQTLYMKHAENPGKGVGGEEMDPAEAKYPVSPETVEAPVYLKSRPACVLCMIVCRRVCVCVCVSLCRRVWVCICVGG